MLWVGGMYSISAHCEDGYVHPNDVLHDFTHCSKLILILLHHLIISRLGSCFPLERGEGEKREGEKRERGKLKTRISLKMFPPCRCNCTEWHSKPYQNKHTPIDGVWNAITSPQGQGTHTH